MSLRKPAKDQPENFEFNSSSLEKVKKIINVKLDNPINPLKLSGN